MVTKRIAFCFWLAAFMTCANSDRLKSLERKVRNMENYILDVSLFEYFH